MVDATQILGELLGGNRGRGNLNTGSGAKMLEELLGVERSQQQGGGVFGGGDQRTGGGLSGDRQAGGGGVFGGSQQAGGGSAQKTGAGGLGDLLGKALKEITGQQGQPQTQAGGTTLSNNPFEMPQQAPRINQNQQSEVYIRAMIQAGMADGRLDEQEQQAIVGKIGRMGQAEADFVRAEMAKGSDVNAFIQTVPRGIEEEVYTVSLMAIQLDNKTEAQYLDSLAKGLRVTQQQANAIHDKLGVQRLYS